MRSTITVAMQKPTGTVALRGGTTDRVANPTYANVFRCICAAVSTCVLCCVCIQNAFYYTKYYYKYTVHVHHSWPTFVIM